MLFNSVLVTGANRGIGLQFVKNFLKLGNNQIGQVIATYRNPKNTADLNELAKSNSNLNLLQLDTKDYANYDNFKGQVSKIVGNQGLSLLINNAGIAFVTTLDNVTPEKMMELYEVNTVTPLMLSKSLLPLLRQSSKNGNRTMITNISSKMGSMEDNQQGSYYAYRASKAALNQVTVSMSVDLKKDKIVVNCIHPGWVKTRMGTDRATMTTEESVSSMIKVLTDQNKDLNAKFLNYDGQLIKW